MCAFNALSNESLEDVVNVFDAASLEVARVGAHDRDLHVFLANLLLHDILKGLQDKFLGLGQGHI